jgi:hypothetical protein
MRNGKAYVFDRNALGQVLTFVKRLYLQDIVCLAGVIQIGCIEMNLKIIVNRQGTGIFIKNGVIRLEVDNPARFQKFTVNGKKPGGGKAFFGPDSFLLGIGESNPDFGDLILVKISLDVFNAGTKKTHIHERIPKRLLRPRPHAGTFNIDAQKILLRIFSG